MVSPLSLSLSLSPQAYTNAGTVVKNPLSREYYIPPYWKASKLTNGTAAEHHGGQGVACELFELGLENFVVRNLTIVWP